MNLLTVNEQYDSTSNNADECNHLVDYTQSRALVDDESIGVEDIMAEHDDDEKGVPYKFDTFAKLRSKLKTTPLHEERCDQSEEIIFSLKRNMKQIHSRSLDEEYYEYGDDVPLSEPQPSTTPLQKRKPAIFIKHDGKLEPLNLPMSPVSPMSEVDSCVNSPLKRDTISTAEIQIDFSSMDENIELSPPTKRESLDKLTGLTGIDDVFLEDDESTEESPENEKSSSEPASSPSPKRRSLRKSASNDGLRNMCNDLIKAHNLVEMEKEQMVSPLKSSRGNNGACEDTVRTPGKRQTLSRSKSCDVRSSPQKVPIQSPRTSSANSRVISIKTRRGLPIRSISSDMLTCPRSPRNMTLSNRKLLNRSKSNDLVASISSKENETFTYRGPRAQETLIKQLHKQIEEAAKSEAMAEKSDYRDSSISLLALQSSMRGSRMCATEEEKIKQNPNLDKEIRSRSPSRSSSNEASDIISNSGTKDRRCSPPRRRKSEQTVIIDAKQMESPLKSSCSHDEVEESSRTPGKRQLPSRSKSCNIDLSAQKLPLRSPRIISASPRIISTNSSRELPIRSKSSDIILDSQSPRYVTLSSRRHLNRSKSNDMVASSPSKESSNFTARGPRAQEKLIKQLYKEIEKAAASEARAKRRGHRDSSISLIALQTSMRGNRMSAEEENIKQNSINHEKDLSPLSPARIGRNEPNNNISTPNNKQHGHSPSSRSTSERANSISPGPRKMLHSERVDSDFVPSFERSEKMAWGNDQSSSTKLDKNEDESDSEDNIYDFTVDTLLALGIMEPKHVADTLPTLEEMQESIRSFFLETNEKQSQEETLSMTSSIEDDEDNNRSKRKTTLSSSRSLGDLYMSSPCDIPSRSMKQTDGNTLMSQMWPSTPNIGEGISHEHKERKQHMSPLKRLHRLLHKSYGRRRQKQTTGSKEINPRVESCNAPTKDRGASDEPSNQSRPTSPSPTDSSGNAKPPKRTKSNSLMSVMQQISKRCVAK